MTKPDRTMEDRIQQLESHIAHQEQVIEDLSDMTARQWDAIDKLARIHERLKSRLDLVEDVAGASDSTSDSASEKPPHY